MKTCPNCLNKKNKHLAKYKGFSTLFSNKQIIYCLNCTIGFIYPQPSIFEIDDYNKNYFKNAHSYINQSSEIDRYNHSISKIRLFFLYDTIKSIEKKRRNILEIGPGYGHFMMHLKEKYPHTNYFIDETDKSLIKKLEKRGAFVTSNNLQEEKIDLVIISHVIEHSLNPVKFLKEKTRFLKKGGFVFIEVPCNDFIYKNNYEPHTLFFNKKALQTTLEKSGFSEIRLSYHGDTHNQIRYYLVVKKIILKLCKFFNLPMKFFFKKSFPNNSKYGLSNKECESLIITNPHTTAHDPSRWLRAIAKKI